MSINTATATYKQYQPCEHRRGSAMLGTNVKFYTEPCPTCEELDASANRGAMVTALLVLLAFLTYLIA